MAFQPAVPPRAPAAPIAFNLTAIFMALALGGLALAYALDNAGRQLRSPHLADLSTTLVRTVGGVELKVPRALFRYDEPAEAGFSDEIDLRLELPLGIDGRIEPIDVTIIPRSRARPSARLLDGVYLHQFLPEELSGPPGLIGKPLNGSEGFADETVWYDALSARPFVAKCMDGVAGTTAQRCLRTVIFANAAAVYAFDAKVLENWRRFDPEVEAILETIGIRPVR